MKILRLVNNLALVLLVSVSCSTNEKLDLSTPEGLFRQAEIYVQDERYEEAIQKFNEVKSKHPYSHFATLAELKVADVYFQKESYIESQHSYQIFRDLHPKHAKSDYVTFQIGMSFYNQLPSSLDRDLAPAEGAISFFDEVTSRYPQSEFAKQAKENKDKVVHMLAGKEMYIANYYSKQENALSALGRYEFVLNKYPQSDYESQALFGAAKNAFRIGEIDRGKSHYDQLIKLYPQSDEAKRANDEFKSSWKK